MKLYYSVHLFNPLDSNQGHSHPMLSWDCMPPSGGSQIHTHMHGFVGRGHKLGHFRRCIEIGKNIIILHIPTM